ncbi:MAG: hypothetical protein CMM87_00015 [Rickettsiales bacterium]|nr:hypothetical protein [Rickettsiales bacterium]|tara:strand:- start:2592 stop:3467 length:876 start_codon:yes stop_codon:yes gene_type:complete
MTKNLLNNFLTRNFFIDFWGKRFFVFEKCTEFFPKFLINDFLNIVKNTNIFFPELTCINEYGQIPHQKYTKINAQSFSSQVVFEGVRDVLNHGATVRIRDTPYYSESVQKLQNIFNDTFRFKTTISAFYSNLGAEGFNPHYDIRHIFIFQMEGVKKWFLGEKIDEVPRHDFTPHTKFLDPCEKKVLDLRKGEILYIPPGLWHKTKTVRDSLHLAVGVSVPDWYDFMSGYLKYVMKKYDLMRQHLPFEVCEDKINFNQAYPNEHRNLIELLKNDIKKYDWFKFVHKIVDEKP